MIKKDSNGHLINQWAARKSAHEIFCKICSTTINVTLKGFQALIQHTNSGKHKERSKTKLALNQLHLTIATPSDNRPPEFVKLFNPNDCAKRAELIWVMKMVTSNFSASSCTDIASVFNSMFPESVPISFSLSRTKFRYVYNMNYLL